MQAQRAPVHDDEQQPRRGQRRKQAQNAEIPHLARVEIGVAARHARRALRKPQRQQHAQRGHRAIGRDDKGADVKEDWMHSKLGYGSGTNL